MERCGGRGFKSSLERFRKDKMKKRLPLTKVLEILQEFWINKPVRINLLKRSTRSYNFLILCKDGEELILKE